MRTVFGKGNAAGVEQTTVAAGASVDHRMGVFFDFPVDENDAPVAFMPGGFIVFARRKHIIDKARDSRWTWLTNWAATSSKSWS